MLSETRNQRLSAVLSAQLPADLTVTNITDDSRRVTPGALFLAYPGLQADGRDYIPDAIKQGATVICYDSEGCKPRTVNHLTLNSTVFYSLVNLRTHVGKIASAFYNYPSQKLTTVGITGTNGKTSCTQFLMQALTAIECKTATLLKPAVIGTLGYGFLPHLQAHAHSVTDAITTPDAVNLQAELHQLVTEGATMLALEVSSHALDQYRVDGTALDIAVFTQLSRDHLDYHGSMGAYAKAKQRLFDWPGLKQRVLNIDDDFGQYLLTRYPNSLRYGVTSQADIHLAQLKHQEQGFALTINTPWGTIRTLLNLFGEFNVSNVLAVIAVLGELGVSVTEMETCLPQLTAVTGRMQLLKTPKSPKVIIDYAHTPDALQQVLQTLRPHCQGQLWCIFGCGGDRDVGKRAMMGKIAETYSDRVVLTTDNPRYEAPEQIVRHIQAGFRDPGHIVPERMVPEHIVIELDRARAIDYALQQATVNDMILLAGKGHEDYQIVGGQRLPFSDIDYVQQRLNLIQAESA